jgi:hypothetical protein
MVLARLLVPSRHLVLFAVLFSYFTLTQLLHMSTSEQIIWMRRELISPKLWFEIVRSLLSLSRTPILHHHQLPKAFMGTGLVETVNAR